MKKQQTPIVLIALLVVFGGATIALRQRPTDEQPQDPSTSEVTGESRTSVSAKELSSKIKQQAVPKTLAKLDPEDIAAKTEPAILLPNFVDYKPSQNATAATAQWYKEGHLKPTK